MNRIWICFAAGILAVLAVSCSSNIDRKVGQLNELYDEAWQFRLKENPLFATQVGMHDYDGRLPSMTLESIELRLKKNREFLQRLRAITPEGLKRRDRINFRIFERQLVDRISDAEFRGFLLPLTSETGFHTSFARLPDWVPLQTVRDYKNYLSRLNAFPEYTDQHIRLLEEGLKSGMVLPKAVLNGYESTVKPHLVKQVEKSVFYAPFHRFPKHFPKDRKEELAERGASIIMDSVIPAYRRFLEFLRREYIPGCRETLGASALPDGDAYYSFLVRRHTTLDLTPREVHQTGLDEVKRIRAEMLKVIREADFDGGLQEFIQFLRKDPRFYAKTAEELLKEASRIAKRIDGKLPSLFKTLPRLPYGVEPVPEDIAPRYTAGRYVGAPIGGTRAGTFWVNTYDLESRPLYALTSLTLHEAVPGHHLQNALRQELEDLPAFRRFSGINAYGEGWGLYSEWLGIEAGLYDDPYDHFGRLTYEMWRACRLVVDTGIHAFGWSRRQAVDFLAENTALSLHEIGTEVDRYISWPGQALAYKIGELKIRELRKRAEAELGEHFDVREFHDVILLSGPVPLDLLEEQVNRYIEEVSHAAPPSTH